MKYPLTLCIICLSAVLCWPSGAQDIPPIPRVLPPEGLEIPADVRERLKARLATTKKRMEAHKDHALLPDVEIFTKAVELALLHREFYVPKDFEKAAWALDEANQRLDSLDKGQSPWTKATGLIVRGYRSVIDGSAQPYGLVIPTDHEFTKACPLYVWLHGRGDKNTDLHFLLERTTKVGQISPRGAIVLHPFGRHCVGFKHAGEVDVLDATTAVQRGYNADPLRTVLIGFSMGGAGAWHIGARYADRWIAVSPGAGFAETARYQRITPDKHPPEYEQKLWGQYDVPGYVRNLFNTDVIAYSGELDKQIQAARVMEEAYKAEGRELTHLVGPGVEHKYEPKALEELLSRLDTIIKKGRAETSQKVHLQTQTLEVSKMHWVSALRLDEHWREARIDAEIVGPSRIKVETQNVAVLRLAPRDMRVESVLVNGQEVRITDPRALRRSGVMLYRDGDVWRNDPREALSRLAPTLRAKNTGVHGPIDHVFHYTFYVVTPSGKSKNAAFQQWVDAELAHFCTRWRALMRAEPPLIKDTEAARLIDGADPRSRTWGFVFWGDPDSNTAIRKALTSTPVKFSNGKWTLGNVTYDGNRYVPAMIYPRPLPLGYFVLNSGLTFREGHDRTNSQQNPKLPDWAIIDITQPPDAFSPGRIHDAGFFDEEWKLKAQPKAP